MLPSEKKSLIRFLLIYLGSTLLLFSLASWIFYTSQKHHLLDMQRDTLKFKAEQIKQELRNLHTIYKTLLTYPTYPSIESAIYDKNREYIFGTGKDTRFFTPQHNMEDENKLYYFTKVEPHYLGAAFLLVEKALDKEPIVSLQKNIGWFMLGAGILFTLLGIVLGRLFVAPMRDSMTQMNHFIQDATHELNTPISTILTNIEMLEAFGKCDKNVELQRIEIASKTLSRIYDDLTYLNLNHEYYRHIESLNLSALLQERIVYFSVMAENKGINIEENIDVDVIIDMDKNDAIRLIDNLISNAIKYNKPKGNLSLALSSKSFSVKDTGIGIEQKDLESISHRFKRANSSEGGFGIGLAIVNQIVKAYEFILEIDSELNVGTKAVVRWSK